MKLIYTLTASAAIMMAITTASIAKDNGPCNPGNAVFCGIQGPQGPAGASGSDGIDGQNGRDGIAGRDGRNGADALSAIATLQTRTPIAGEWTGALGLTGADSVDGAALGVRYGLSDRSDVYAIVGHSRDGVTTWAAGVTFVIGGK
jgi:hypothetical protein